MTRPVSLRKPPTPNDTPECQRRVASAIVQHYGAKVDAAGLVKLSELEATEWCLDWFGETAPLTVAIIREVRDYARLTGIVLQLGADREITALALANAYIAVQDAARAAKPDEMAIAQRTLEQVEARYRAMMQISSIARDNGR